MNGINIIFLDIDGVLNTLSHLRRQKRESGSANKNIWCPVSCKHISLLCHTYNARIVISSSWRHEYTLDQIKEFFESNNIPPEYLIDRTPSTAPQPDGENYCRGHEIQYWLENFPVEVSSYVIIDDEAIFLEKQQPHLIRVDKKSGFSPKEMAIQASYILTSNKIN